MNKLIATLSPASSPLAFSPKLLLRPPRRKKPSPPLLLPLQPRLPR